MLDSWALGEVTFGLWGTLDGAYVAEIAAAEGFAYHCVDRQHGMIGEAAVAPMLTAIQGQGASALVRVPANEPWLIMQALDAGADGVVVPMVGDGAEAAAAVAACRYPPDGMRSYGPTRATLAHRSADTARLSEVACIAMIETSRGLVNLEEIVATPGLDAIYIGPSDLALALGVAPDQGGSHPAHGEAIARILATCLRRGVTPGIQCPDGVSARARAEQGFQMVSVGNDMATLRRGLAAELAIAREPLTPEDHHP